jgi:two-component system phosphate regulon sensor histidine kinase PhoR
MKKKIFRSILLVAAAVLLSSLALIMGVLYRTNTDAQYKQLGILNDLAARGVEREGMDYFSDLDTAGYRITWVAGDGTVLYDSRADASAMENHADREEIREAKESGIGQSERRSATLAQTTLYHAQRLSDGSALRLSVTQTAVLALVLRMLLPALIILLASVALSALLAGRLSRG